jgi:hypothetical protein
MFGPRSTYYPSPYVDEYGENQHNSRGKPLALNEDRYEHLRILWARNGIASEVTQKRSSAKRIIIIGYY